MKEFLHDLFTLHQQPRRGLMAYEWATLAYLFITLAVALLFNTHFPNSSTMIWGRMKILAIILAVWGTYRLLPCGLTLYARVVVHLSLLSWWYPDIYEFNRILPNLDHLFASWEQALFGCQPALLFSKYCSHWVFSELMCLGYTCYYPLLAIVVIAIMLTHKTSVERVVFIILGTFFIHYVIFLLLPVAGPQFYYPAVGMDDIAQGVFPNLHHYFNHHRELMTCPGYADGVFYDMVQSAHDAGERPIAAFPSSHVSVCVVLMIIPWRYRLKGLFWVLLPFAILLFLSTVYICAHYAIDALAGIVSGTLCYLLLAASNSRLEHAHGSGKTSKGKKAKKRK